MTRDEAITELSKARTITSVENFLASFEKTALEGDCIVSVKLWPEDSPWFVGLHVESDEGRMEYEAIATTDSDQFIAWVYHHAPDHTQDDGFQYPEGTTEDDVLFPGSIGLAN
jgi:hypothetical protein